MDVCPQTMIKCENIKRKIWGEINSTGFIYLPGSQFRQAEITLELRSFLHYAIINAEPRILKFVNKNELYIQCPPIYLKDTNLDESKNSSCGSSVKKLLLVKSIGKMG